MSYIKGIFQLSILGIFIVIEISFKLTLSGYVTLYSLSNFWSKTRNLLIKEICFMWDEDLRKFLSTLGNRYKGKKL